MQLNSVTVMDLVAYGGPRSGVLLAISQLARGRIDLAGCFAIVMLSAEFFLPLRLLGKLFSRRHERHVGKRTHLSPAGFARGSGAGNTARQASPAPLYESLFSLWRFLIPCRASPFSLSDVGFYGIVGASGAGKPRSRVCLAATSAAIEGSVQIRWG